MLYTPTVKELYWPIPHPLDAESRSVWPSNSSGAYPRPAHSQPGHEGGGGCLCLTERLGGGLLNYISVVINFVFIDIHSPCSVRTAYVVKLSPYLQYGCQRASTQYCPVPDLIRGYQVPWDWLSRRHKDTLGMGFPLAFELFWNCCQHIFVLGSNLAPVPNINQPCSSRSATAVRNNL